MAKTRIRFQYVRNGAPTDVASATLSDPTGTYGVRRQDNHEIVVPDGTALARVGQGTYEFTFDDPAPGLTYEYYLEVSYGGATQWYEREIDGGSLGDGEILTLSALKEHLRLDAADATFDDKLASLILGAEAAVLQLLGRDSFLSAPRVEDVRAESARAVRVAHWPVSSIGSVTLYPDSRDEQVIDGSQFRVNGVGTIRFKRDADDRQPFPPGPGDVRVSYEGGWPEAPGDLLLALKQVAAAMFHASERDGGVQSEKLGAYSYSLAPGWEKQDAFASAASLLGPYLPLP